MTRHKWSTPSRPSELETVRTCTRCGLLRVTRHEGALAWIEWRTTEDKRIDSFRTPPCDASVPSTFYSDCPDIA